MTNCRKKRILIIAEGLEEKLYIDKLLSFPNINHDVYDIKPAINVKGNAKIAARYQYLFQSNYYDLILIFCDADKGSDVFNQLLDEIGSLFPDKKDALRIVMFANPVTLQIVLSHFGDVCITRIGKKSNADTVEKLTGIKDYDAKTEQIEEMVNKIHYNSIDSFKRRIKSISDNVDDIPSTNILSFVERFESEDTSWIDEIINLMICN